MTHGVEAGADAVAVVGLGCVFPGADDVDAFWRNIVGGVDAVTAAPADRVDTSRFPSGRGGFVTGDALAFDPARFGIMPVAAEGSEPDQLIALATAAAALDDAGGAEHVDRSRVGVILGRGSYLTPGLARLDQRVRAADQLLTSLRDLLPDVDDDRLVAVRDAFAAQLGDARPEAAIGLVPNLAASRIANRLDLGGPAYTVDAACASSLVAVDAALAELRSGRCDMVLAGGVHHCHDVTLWSVFHQLGALSPSGGIRPFSRDADGIVIGEGTGILVLEPLARAEARGHRIYAVVRGTGVASDGRDTSLMTPRVEGQVLALERAYRAAGVDPASIGLVEGHGTATAAGDAAELDTVRRIFGKPTDAPHDPAGVLGSVKSMIGHAMPAAGAAGLIKAVLAVHHGVLPPTLHAGEPHPALADTRFRVLGEAEPWVATGPRRAGVNAFGFGGVNAHVVVEQHGSGAVATGPLPETVDDEAVLLLAGRDAADVAAQLERIVPGEPLPPAPAPDAGPARLAVVAPNERRLELARRAVAKDKPLRGLNDVWFEPHGLVAGGGRVAFLFPGVEPTFDADLGPVARRFGRPLPALPEGCTPLEAQGRQIFAAGRLLHGVLADLGVSPDDMAGHSMGEWTAAFTAELVPADDADRFIDELEPGALEVPGVDYLALGCGAPEAAELIAGVEGMTVSHDNCVHQSVVCGPTDGVAAVRQRAGERQVVAQDMPFRSGFHSPAFAPHVGVIGRHWARARLAPPQVPMWSATTCDRWPEAPDAVRALVEDQLVQPVRFRELIERMHDDGVRVFLQLGVGSLVAFVDDTLRGRPHLAIPAHTAKRSGVAQLRRVLAALWAEGVACDPHRIAPEAPGRGPRLRLDLGTALVRLPESVRLTGAIPAARGAAVPAADLAGTPAVLRDAHESLLAEALAAGSKVAAALARQATAIPGAGPAPAPAAVPAPAPIPATLTRTVEIGTDSHPWLRDHSFYRQAPGWPDVADGFPVVPMTTMVEMLADAARELVPDQVVVSIEDVRAQRWLLVAPPASVTLSATRIAPDRVQVSLDGYARATVRLAPAGEVPPAPAPATGPLTNPRPSPRDAVQLYDEHWMFHGPAFQGVRHIGDLGDDGVDGVVEALATPGATLDNAGQLYGWWVMATASSDFLALPQSIERIDLFRALTPGRRYPTRVRITALDDRTVRADLELLDGDGDGDGPGVGDTDRDRDGCVAVRITGWVDRRFDSDPPLWDMLRDPEDHLLGTVAPAGFVVVDERWKDSASRELIARRYLNGTERATYEGLNPRAQRHWLLGRIAAKDAVRRALWDEGHPPVFPAEITIGNDPDGVPHVVAGPGRGRPLAISHTSWVGAARCGPVGGEGLGIDIDTIAPRSPGLAAVALNPAEEALLPALDDEWLTRAWAAKEAAGKATGRGVGGRPRDLRIRAVDGERLLVEDRWVATARLAAPVQRTWGGPGEPPDTEAEREDHVVAWTEHTDHTRHPDHGA